MIQEAPSPLPIPGQAAKDRPYTAPQANWLARDAHGTRRRIEAMEKLLEGLWTIPGTGQRVGLDVILDFLPVGGPLLATAMGAWLAWEARNLGMPRSAYVRMAGNLGLDAVFSAIPLIGAIPDFFFRANTRNLKIVRRWLDHHHPATAVIDDTGRPGRRARP